MAYNKAKEEKKWKNWKEEEEKQLRKWGMEEGSIQLLRQADWDDFNSERRYLEHQAVFAEESDLHTVEIGEPEINSIQPLLDYIDDKRLLHILLEADRKTLQIILLKVMGFSVGEIADRIEMSEKAIYCRIDRLKKKIKNI